MVTSARRNLLPWLVWGVSLLAYVVAIINRSSLAALGPATQEHFGIEATALASFAMIQLIVYAIMQIPVGVLLDRFGASALILVGGLLMVVGQVVMATVHEVSLAILARILVGAGDACTFISVISMLPRWFSVRQLPTLSQLTGLVGQVGQLISVTPLAIVVGTFGWDRGFIGVAAVGLLVMVVAFFVLRDSPGTGSMFERMTHRMGKRSSSAASLGVHDSTAMLAAVAPPDTEMMPALGKPKRRVPGVGFWRSAKRLLSIPGVRLAYWIHFTTPFPTNVFLLLWGTPFLTGGLGLSASAAGGYLSLIVVTGMFTSLVLGPLSSRFVERRVWITVGIVLVIMTNWVLVLCWPGSPPTWLVISLMIVIAFGTPASMVSFEVSRSHTPRSFAGFSTGLVNTGGFTSTLLVILLIGLVLDLQGAGSPEAYTLDAFRWAFAVQVPFWLFGLAMVFREIKRTGEWMRANGRTLR